MEVLEAIFTRRSIRKYSGEPILDEDLTTILRAGSQAPSAMNAQPWHFVVVREAALLEEIATGHRYAKFLPQAGCCVVVCGDPERQGQRGFLIEDCSAAIENMLLAAHGLGLGAVWCGLYPVTRLTKMMTRLLKLPPKIVPIGMVVVGHAAEKRPPEERFDPTRVHYEGWL